MPIASHSCEAHSMIARIHTTPMSGTELRNIFDKKSVLSQQFPLMTCESYVTMAADSSIHVSTIPFRLLKRLPRSDMPGCLVASRLIARLRHRFPTMTGDRLSRWHVVAEGTEGEIKKNPTQSWGWASSNRKTGLRAVAAWTQEHSHRTTLSSAPTAGVYCPAWPILLETRHNSTAGFGPPETPTSSSWQTPRKDFACHDRNCARSGSLDFSAY